MSTIDERILEYGRQGVALLAPGRAHDVAPGSVRAKFLEAFLSLFARADCRSADLLVESNPRTTTELLPDWERALGLPDCDPIPGSLVLRRFALVAKLASAGGQSIQYLIDVAAEAGFTVTVEEHHHFRCGVSRVGSGGTFGGETFPPGRLWSGGTDVAPDAWTFTFTVRAPEFSPTFFGAGESGAGDPLVDTNNALLPCILDAIRPAHTVVHYEFTDPPEPGYGPWEELGPSPATLVATVGNVTVFQV